MSYKKVNWKNYPDTTTPISAENLQKMDNGIADNDVRIEEVKSEFGEKVEELNSNLDNLIITRNYTKEVTVGANTAVNDSFNVKSPEGYHMIAATVLCGSINIDISLTEVVGHSFHVRNFSSSQNTATVRHILYI